MYRFIKDLTSDVMYEAKGVDLKEVFEDSARALFDIICQRDSIEKKKEVIVEAKGEDAGDLMYNWLQALIASVDIDEMFYNDFEVIEIDENHVKANCFGETITKEKGETVVKAVTYHNFKFEKTDDGYSTTVVVDI